MKIKNGRLASTLVCGRSVRVEMAFEECLAFLSSASRLVPSISHTRSSTLQIEQWDVAVVPVVAGSTRDLRTALSAKIAAAVRPSSSLEAAVTWLCLIVAVV